MSEDFTILWVEDSEKVISSQEEEIGEFVSEQGFQLRLLKDHDGSKYQEYLESEDIDLMIVDNNISEAVNGLDIVKYVRERGTLTDFLFYSAKGLDEEIMVEVNKMGLQVQFCDDKDVVLPVEDLIEKNLRRYLNISYLRGCLISRFIDLELTLNATIEVYFGISADKKAGFHDYVLENRYVSFIGKRLAIRSILDEKDLRNKYQNLLKGLENANTSRNEIAHCKVKDTNTLVSMGKYREYGRDQVKASINNIMETQKKLEALTEELQL